MHMEVLSDNSDGLILKKRFRAVRRAREDVRRQSIADWFVV
jgi:hypothetical protein